MKIDKNFKTQWMNEISKMSQAIGNNDLYEATKHKEKADALFEEAKRINEYFENPSKTFGVMNNAIKKYVSSEYLKENKKPIADYISKTRGINVTKREVRYSGATKVVYRIRFV